MNFSVRSFLTTFMSKLNLRRKSPNFPQDKGSAEQHPPAHVLPTKARRMCTPTTFLKLLITACLVTFSWMHTSSSSSKVLSSSYAICSRRGRAIYTVDSKSSTAQCLLVHGSRILGTGSLCECFHRISCLSLTWEYGIVEVKELWRSATVEGSQMTFDAPLEIRFLPSKAIVVPGMSGEPPAITRN